MKTVLITGASGYLGHHLIDTLLKRNDTKVIGILGRPEDKAHMLPVNKNFVVYPCSALFDTNFGHVDTLIHTAFSRGENLPGLTRSIELSEQIVDLVNRQDIDSIINISSQGIYKGLIPGQRVKEDGYVEPNTSYGLAKWAVEKIIEIGCKKKYTNIRMASLSANARFLKFFVDCLLAGKDITITAPKQYASIMDVRDAVAGILSIENLSIDKREKTYNLGPGVQYSILDFAKSVEEIGKSFTNNHIEIIVEDNGKDFAICMDCSKLEDQTGWKPTIMKDEIISNLFNHNSVQHA